MLNKKEAYNSTDDLKLVYGDFGPTTHVVSSHFEQASFGGERYLRALQKVLNSRKHVYLSHDFFAALIKKMFGNAEIKYIELGRVCYTNKPVFFIGVDCNEN